MVATFSSILPRLSEIMSAITLDGNSGRSLYVPIEYPDALTKSYLPTVINRMTITPVVNANIRAQKNFLITINSRLHLSEVGTQLGVINQYDIYSYADKFLTLTIDNPQLQDADRNTLDGIQGRVELGGVPIVPSIQQYPQGLQNAPYFNCLDFTFTFNFQIAKDC
jgi:hypothetical protein